MGARKRSYHVPERFLRQLWKHRSFLQNGLSTTDGHPLEILEVGNLNHDSGPDFLGARVRIGGVLYHGDIEIHQSHAEWETHNHHLDRKYNSVILHVVFHESVPSPPPTTSTNRSVPVLALNRFLTAPYRSAWNQMILDERAERLQTIKCFDRNKDVEASVLRRWLKKLAVERIELKVRRFEERLKEMIDQRRPIGVSEPPRFGEIPFGLHPDELPPPGYTYTRRDFSPVQLWIQLLYEGVMEALGYSKNQQAFLRLAQAIPIEELARMIKKLEGYDHSICAEALLFHTADLIPDDRSLADPESLKRVRKMREIRERLSPVYRNVSLNSTDWQFFRLRPENFPTIRIAGAAQFISRIMQKGFFTSITQTIKSREQSSVERFRTIEGLFLVPADEFWSTHYRFEERTTKGVTMLIGRNRVHDIIVNVIVPIALLYARIFRDKDTRQGALKILEECSPGAENTVTRIMEEQLIGGKMPIDSAMLQQGSLQLYKFYCAEERCAECAIGKIVFAVT